MPDLTVRGIPSDIMDKIKILSKTERRSINSEILLMIENGLKDHIEKRTVNSSPVVSKETQMEIWENLSGKWEDIRDSEEIMSDIYNKRTKGRDVEL